MTRKDYELIARTLFSVSETGCAEICSDSESAVRTFHFVCNKMADALYRDNPRFDRVKFLQACGVNV